MIDEVFRKNKTDKKITDADERFLKISLMPDGSKVVDAKSSRIAYVADPKDDKDAINKSWATKYFKEEKDAVTKLGESATAKSAEIENKLIKFNQDKESVERKGEELNTLKSNLEALKTSLEALVSTGVIDDTKVGTTQTYSSKKIEDLVKDAKSSLTADIKSAKDTLTADIKSKTDTITASIKDKTDTLAKDIKTKTDALSTTITNQGQAITALDSKATATQNNLNSFVAATSDALRQKVNTSAHSTFASQVTTELGKKVNISEKGVANGVASLNNLGKVPIDQLPKIDTYTKAESDTRYIQKENMPSSLPTGAYVLYSSNSNIPSGFLWCDGSALDKTAYAKLFSVIGYTYGQNGDKFLLPNFSDGKFMRSTGGNAAALGIPQGDAIRNITGAFLNPVPHYYKNDVFGAFFKGTVNSTKTQLNTDNGSNISEINMDASKVVPTANENRPLNMSVVVLIKY